MPTISETIAAMRRFSAMRQRQATALRADGNHGLAAGYQGESNTVRHWADVVAASTPDEAGSTAPPPEPTPMPPGALWEIRCIVRPVAAVDYVRDVVVWATTELEAATHVHGAIADPLVITHCAMLRPGAVVIVK